MVIEEKPINVSNTTLSLNGRKRHRKFDVKQSKRHNFGQAHCVICDEVFTKYAHNKRACSIECVRKKRKAWQRKHYGKYYEENREKLNATKRKYYKENPEKLRKRNRKYREENREKLLAYQCEYREENREELNANKRKYYEENREKELARHRKYYEKNREKISAKAHARYLANKEE